MRILVATLLLFWATTPLARTSAQTQTCTAYSDTTSGTALSRLADSAALLRALGAVSTGTEAVSLVYVGYERDGTPAEVDAYRKSGPVEDTRSLKRALLPLLRPQPRSLSVAGFGYWIQVVDSPAPGLRHARFRQECAPVLRHADQIARLLQQEYQRVRAKHREMPVNTADALVRIRIDARGRPVEVRLQQHTGIIDLDIAATRVARQMRFVPARLDEYTVGTWVILPLRFRA